MKKDKFYKFLNSDRYQYTEAEIYFENGFENRKCKFRNIKRDVYKKSRRIRI